MKVVFTAHMHKMSKMTPETPSIKNDIKAATYRLHMLTHGPLLSIDAVTKVVCDVYLGMT